MNRTSPSRVGLEAVRFATELAAVVLTPWGVTGAFAGPWRWPAALGATAAVVATWGRFVAPKSAHRLADPARLAVEAVAFLVAGACTATRSVPVAAGFTAVALAVALALRAPSPAASPEESR